MLAFLTENQEARGEIHTDHLVQEAALGLRKSCHRADEGTCLFEGFLSEARLTTAIHSWLSGTQTMESNSET